MSTEKEKHLVQKIVSIGFTEYEAKVFLVLYKGYRMSAAEIAKLAKIPRTSVYDILRIFVTKGLCNEIETPSKLIYEVIDSKVIEDKTKNDIIKDYNRKLSNFDACFNELRTIYKSEQPPEYKADVELVKGFNRQREQKFLDLVKNSKKAILFMNRLEGKVSTELDEVTKQFYKRGGTFKSIYEPSDNFQIKINNQWKTVTHETLVMLCESFIAQGEEIKLLNKVPQVVAIFDERVVYFRLRDENIPLKDSSDIIIKNKNFASFITNLFNVYWDKADTIEQFKKYFLNKNQSKIKK